jgi:hypothetical protein
MTPISLNINTNTFIHKTQTKKISKKKKKIKCLAINGHERWQ